MGKELWPGMVILCVVEESIFILGLIENLCSG